MPRSRGRPGRSRSRSTRRRPASRTGTRRRSRRRTAPLHRAAASVGARPVAIARSSIAGFIASMTARTSFCSSVTVTGSAERGFALHRRSAGPRTSRPAGGDRRSAATRAPRRRAGRAVGTGSRRRRASRAVALGVERQRARGFGVQPARTRPKSERAAKNPSAAPADADGNPGHQVSLWSAIEPAARSAPSTSASQRGDGDRPGADVSAPPVQQPEATTRMTMRAGIRSPRGKRSPCRRSRVRRHPPPALRPAVSGGRDGCRWRPRCRVPVEDPGGSPYGRASVLPAAHDDRRDTRRRGLPPARTRSSATAACSRSARAG